MLRSLSLSVCRVWFLIQHRARQKQHKTTKIGDRFGRCDGSAQREADVDDEQRVATVERRLRWFDFCVFRRLLAFVDFGVTIFFSRVKRQIDRNNANANLTTVFFTDCEIWATRVT